MIVIKRDDSKELFDLEKIKVAIEKAAGREVTDQELDGLQDFFTEPEDAEIGVEEIHSRVKKFLMEHGLYDIAEQYIIGEHRKRVIREMDSELIKGISEKIKALNVQNQNANLDEAEFLGRASEANRYVLKDYALNYCMSKKSKKNHLNNEIYIHK